MQAGILSRCVVGGAAVLGCGQHGFYCAQLWLALLSLPPPTHHSPPPEPPSPSGPSWLPRPQTRCRPPAARRRRLRAAGRVWVACGPPALARPLRRAADGHPLIQPAMDTAASSPAAVETSRSRRSAQCILSVLLLRNALKQQLRQAAAHRAQNRAESRERRELQ